eukprot:SAG31_NODE_47_length_30979_cov_41.708841_28_plen_91_part_00
MPVPAAPLPMFSYYLLDLHIKDRSKFSIVEIQTYLNLEQHEAYSCILKSTLLSPRLELYIYCSAYPKRPDIPFLGIFAADRQRDRYTVLE